MRAVGAVCACSPPLLPPLPVSNPPAGTLASPSPSPTGLPRQAACALLLPRVSVTNMVTGEAAYFYCAEWLRSIDAFDFELDAEGEQARGGMAGGLEAGGCAVA